MVTTQNFVLRMLGSPGGSTDGAGFQGEMQPRTWMLQTAGFQFHCLLAPISDSVQFFVCLLFFFVLFCFVLSPSLFVLSQEPFCVSYLENMTAKDLTVYLWQPRHPKKIHFLLLVPRPRGLSFTSFGLVPLSGWARPTAGGVIQEMDH